MLRTRIPILLPPLHLRRATDLQNWIWSFVRRMGKANRKLKTKQNSDKAVDHHNEQKGKGGRQEVEETKFLDVSVQHEWLVVKQRL